MFAIVQEITKKIKHTLEDREAFMFLLFLALTIGAFGLGRASVRPAEVTAGVYFINATGTSEKLVVTPARAAAASAEVSAGSGKFIGSRSGTKYYTEHCPGLNRIKPENRVYFPSEAEARADGRTLAAGCH